MIYIEAIISLVLRKEVNRVGILVGRRIGFVLDIGLRGKQWTCWPC